MIIRESHNFWSDKYNVLDWPHIQLLLTGSILSWNKPLAPNLKFSVTLLHHKLKTEKQRERNNAITSTFKITNDQFQSRRNSDCLVFMWHSSSQLTGQEHNVTPGDKSGRGKSTCRVGQVWDLWWSATLSSCCIALRGCKWSYCWVCTSPPGSTHRWWPPPHLQSGNINH